MENKFKKNIFIIAIVLVFVTIPGLVVFFSLSRKQITQIETNTPLVNDGGPGDITHPLAIENMKEQVYPGSDIVFEQTLPDGSNYKKYIVSYRSDGLKIYSLMTIPKGEKPISGWPTIIFNHGYIPPAQYRTTEKYIAYTDAFSKNGYILLKPDYRGHGNSEGNPEGAYYSPAYTVDVLNALSSIKRFPNVDPNKIGMWGHSMGGNITLRSMVVSPADIKAAVIWAGVVASYEDMANNWNRRRTFTLSERERGFNRPNRQNLIDTYGSFEENSDFWKSISPIYHVQNILGPIQIHHGTDDETVPILFSQKLEESLKANSKISEFYIYEGDDHNLSKNLGSALNRSVIFFDKYLKN